MFILQTFVVVPQVCNESKRYEKKSNFKIFKVMNSISNTKFNNYILSNTFNDEYIQFKQHVAIIFRCLAQKLMILIHLSILYVYLIVLAPNGVYCGPHYNAPKGKSRYTQTRKIESINNTKTFWKPYLE